MLENFEKDLSLGKEAEQIIYDLAIAAGYKVEDVSNIPECRYKGDLLITLPSGQELYIEVKNDNRIADTQNILCEEEVYYKDADYYGAGNMQCNSDYFVIVSKQDRKIYILDFPQLQKVYQNGEFRILEHKDQESYCYLLEVWKAKKLGALIDIINY